jgi:hypothetical protein
LVRVCPPILHFPSMRAHPPTNNRVACTAPTPSTPPRVPRGCLAPSHCNPPPPSAYSCLGGCGIPPCGRQSCASRPCASIRPPKIGLPAQLQLPTKNRAARAAPTPSTPPRLPRGRLAVVTAVPLCLAPTRA